MIMQLTVFKEVHNTWPAKNGKPAGESYDLLCMDNSNLRWTPKTGPQVKMDFRWSAGEKKADYESKTETA